MVQLPYTADKDSKVSSISPADADEIKLKFKQATALATIQAMLSKLSIRCFHKCVSRPAESLDNYEQKCISLCMDRYVDSYNLVARAYGKRLQQELKKGQEEQQDELS